MPIPRNTAVSLADTPWCRFVSLSVLRLVFFEKHRYRGHDRDHGKRWVPYGCHIKGKESDVIHALLCAIGNNARL